MELLRLGMRKQASLESHPVQYAKLRLGEENGRPVILREPNSPVITSEMVLAILESEDEDYFELPELAGLASSVEDARPKVAGSVDAVAFAEGHSPTRLDK